MTITPQTGLAEAQRESDTRGGAANTTNVAAASLAMANEIIQGMACGDLDRRALAALARNSVTVDLSTNKHVTIGRSDYNYSTHTHYHSAPGNPGINQETLQEMLDKQTNKIVQEVTKEVERIVQEKLDKQKKQIERMVQEKLDRQTMQCPGCSAGPNKTIGAVANGQTE